MSDGSDAKYQVRLVLCVGETAHLEFVLQWGTIAAQQSESRLLREFHRSFHAAAAARPLKTWDLLERLLTPEQRRWHRAAKSLLWTEAPTFRLFSAKWRARNVTISEESAFVLAIDAWACSPQEI